MRIPTKDPGDTNSMQKNVKKPKKSIGKRIENIIKNTKKSIGKRIERE